MTEENSMWETLYKTNHKYEKKPIEQVISWKVFFKCKALIAYKDWKVFIFFDTKVASDLKNKH